MRKVVDWEAVEKDWRAGIKSKKQISEEHDVSRAAMDKRFNKLGVHRDLKAQIQAKADALVARSAALKVTCGDTVTQAQIVDSNAQTQAHVHITQRQDVTRLNEYIRKLRETIEGMAINEEELPRLIDMTKKLSETMKIAIGLEREAYGISSSVDETRAPAGLNHFYGD